MYINEIKLQTLQMYDQLLNHYFNLSIQLIGHDPKTGTLFLNTNFYYHPLSKSLNMYDNILILRNDDNKEVKRYRTYLKFINELSILFHLHKYSLIPSDKSVYGSKALQGAFNDCGETNISVQSLN